MNELSAADLEALERDVLTALAAADPTGLTLLGEGEISLVLAGGEDRSWACKRLPPFATPEAADRYATTIERYLGELARRGIDVVDTSVRRLAGDDGRTVLYCVQPVLPADTLGIAVANRDPERGGQLLERIVDLVVESVDERFGLDAQLSNWALVDDRPAYLDVTTPLLRSEDGIAELDTDVFLASLPWLLRPAVRRFVVPGIIARYHDPHVVVLDLAANLLRERLDHLVPVVVAAADGRVVPPLDDRTIRHDRRLDAVTWGALQAVRRVDRTWQRRIRRRPYPFLIPSHRHT